MNFFVRMSPLVCKEVVPARVRTECMEPLTASMVEDVSGQVG